MCIRDRPRSNYNFIIENISFAGEGALLQLIEQRKKKLQKLGYFDEKNKKKLPYIPNIIGIITSPSGAVIEDIKKRIKERFPSNILLWPVAVQGNNAEQEIESAILGFNSYKKKPDVIILARGGGSLEDIMAFNSEEIASSIFGSKIPIISAVGHETDFTISDFVADLRAPTPSAAAEILVPEKEEIQRNLHNLTHTLKSRVINTIERQNERIDYLGTRTLVNEPIRILSELEQSTDWKSESLQKSFLEALGNKEKSISDFNQRLTLCHPAKQLEEVSGKLKIISQSLEHNLSKKFNEFQEKYERSALSLKSLGPYSVLERGFSLTQDGKGNLITSSKEMSSGDKIITRFKDGDLKSTID